METVKRVVVAAFLLAGAAGTQVWAQETIDPWTVSTSVSYSQGDYGGDTTTKTVYAPVTLQRNFAEGDVWVSLPYIAQHNGSSVVQAAGGPVSTGTGASRPGWESGFGDILLGGDYYLLQEAKRHWLDLVPFAIVKFPTADDDRGLGTGKFDEIIGVKAAKKLKDNWSVLGNMGFIFLGDPPGLELRNQFFYSIGPGYQLTQRTFMSLLYEERTKIVSGQPNARDLVLGVDHALDNKVSIFGNIGGGLTSSAPDFFATAGVSIRF